MCSLYYAHYPQYFRSHTDTRPSSSLNEQNNPTSRIPINSRKSLFCILCRLTCCLVLFIITFFLTIIALFLFGMSISYTHRESRKDRLFLIAFLAIVIILCKRSCRSLRRYFSLIRTRRQLTQRLHEQQLALSSNNDGNLELVTSGITDLPLYKELFPSNRNIRSNCNNPSSTLLPPSYDDFMKRLVIHHPTTTLPVSSLQSLAFSIPTTSLSSTSPSQVISITDQTQRSDCIPGTITYL